MSESNDTGAMEQFNINELAGATGLILGAVSGILVVIFKSRCFCKIRLGISDKYSLCMCERKPPPDSPRDEDEDDANKPDTDLEKKPIKKPDNKPQTNLDRSSKEKEPEPEPEALVPSKKELDNLV
jgi:hypothetical protein